MYAVTSGKVTGIFKNWLNTSNSVTGISGSQFKGYNSYEDAKDHLIKAGVAVINVDFEMEDLEKLCVSRATSNTFVFDDASEDLRIRGSEVLRI